MRTKQLYCELCENKKKLWKTTKPMIVGRFSVVVYVYVSVTCLIEHNNSVTQNQALLQTCLETTCLS